jgi:hypothetical protein
MPPKRKSTSKKVTNEAVARRGKGVAKAALVDVVKRQGVNARVAKRRAALRKAGLRPVQIWVPDTKRPGFAAECARQSRLLAKAAALAGSDEARMLSELDGLADALIAGERSEAGD